MFKLKLQYLQEDNRQLACQLSDLRKIHLKASQDNNRALLFQFQQDNQSLRQQIKILNAQLLLQRQSRKVEHANHQQQINQMNRYIFQLKKDMAVLQNILRDDKKVQHQSGFIQKWVRNKYLDQRFQVFHQYADPLLFFNILQEMLDLMVNEEQKQQERMQSQAQFFMKTQEEQAAQQSVNYFVQTQPSNKLANQNSYMKTGWLEEKSDVYFLRKKRKENLYIDLQKAKFIQSTLVKTADKIKKQAPLQNIKLLKKSYVELIAQHHKLKKQHLAYQKYIEELQARNQLLLDRIYTQER